MQRLLSRMIHWHPPDPAGSPAERLTRGQDTREAMFRAEPMRGGALDAGDRCTRPGFPPPIPETWTVVDIVPGEGAGEPAALSYSRRDGVERGAFNHPD